MTLPAVAVGVGAGAGVANVFTVTGTLAAVVLPSASEAHTSNVYSVFEVKLFTTIVAATPDAAPPVATVSAPFLTIKFTAPELSVAEQVSLALK